MLRYCFRRLLAAIPTLLVLIFLAFFMVRIAPGGPFDSERTVPPEVAANLNAKYHLDEPLYQQFFRYAGDLLQGDLGPSFQYQDRTVNELIAGGFPVSLTLGILSVIIAFFVGTALGSYAALRQNTKRDYGVMATAMLGISLPSFVIAPLLVLLFSIYLNLLPVGYWNGGALPNLVLPVFVLALPQIAYIARMTRGSMIEVMRSPFILTAKAKGLSPRRVLFRHALKPALLPILSYLGPAAAGVITGSVVIETIFQLPGIGSHFVNGALNRDYTLVMGVVIVYGSLIILFNFLVDLLYAALDPKVRQEYR